MEELFHVLFINSLARLFNCGQNTCGKQSSQCAYMETVSHKRSWPQVSYSMAEMTGTGNKSGDSQIPEWGKTETVHPGEQKALSHLQLAGTREEASRGRVSREQVEVTAQSATVLGHLLAAVKLCARGIAFTLLDKGIHLHRQKQGGFRV